MSGERRRWEITAVHPFRDRVTQTAGKALRLGETVVAVEESAVADAVRAERERLAEALREHTVDRADEDGCFVPMNPFTSWREAADFIERLPPADGNTEEAG